MESVQDIFWFVQTTAKRRTNIVASKKFCWSVCGLRQNPAGACRKFLVKNVLIIFLIFGRIFLFEHNLKEAFELIPRNMRNTEDYHNGILILYALQEWGDSQPEVPVDWTLLFFDLIFGKEFIQETSPTDMRFALNPLITPNVLRSICQ
jgi:hypothetical protein